MGRRGIVFSFEESFHIHEVVCIDIDETSADARLRYLLKLVDQTIAVLSPEQSKSVQWTAPVQATETEGNDLDDAFGRMFAFEVAQTRDEMEGVSSANGFQVFSPLPSSHFLFFDCVSSHRWFSQTSFPQAIVHFPIISLMMGSRLQYLWFLGKHRAAL